MEDLFEEFFKYFEIPDIWKVLIVGRGYEYYYTESEARLAGVLPEQTKPTITSDKLIAILSVLSNYYPQTFYKIEDFEFEVLGNCLLIDVADKEKFKSEIREILLQEVKGKR